MIKESGPLVSSERRTACFRTATTPTPRIPPPARPSSILGVEVARWELRGRETRAAPPRPEQPSNPPPLPDTQLLLLLLLSPRGRRIIPGREALFLPAPAGTGVAPGAVPSAGPAGNKRLARPGWSCAALRCAGRRAPSAMLRCPWGAGARRCLSALRPRAWAWAWAGAAAERGPALAPRLWGWGAREARGAAGTPGARGPREPFPLDGFVSRDVLLFRHERPRFFRNVGLFCASQFAFWLYLAHFAFTSLRDTGAAAPQPASPPGENAPSRAWLGNALNLGSDKWRYGFSASCLAVGTLILVAGFLYARRSVAQVLLLRGSQEVTFTTYYLFGFTSSFTVPLRHISCMSHRSEVAAIIPVKIKGKPFYFLLDKQGEIASTPLFDITVGAYREW
ncbi:transmembrane protein 223 [Candoia aspera]|uniref:transmembrane protein 223 n=1 Tax=Candoia aspera TaxID=51853 RepID=UPI002FD7D1BE